MNRRGWKVLEAVHSDDGSYCVDFFVDADGHFGWAHFRADPEDQGGWTLMARSGHPFDSIAAARTEAVAAIPWLPED